MSVGLLSAPMRPGVTASHLADLGQAASSVLESELPKCTTANGTRPLVEEVCILALVQDVTAGHRRSNLTICNTKSQQTEGTNRAYNTLTCHGSIGNHQRRTSVVAGHNQHPWTSLQTLRIQGLTESARAATWANKAKSPINPTSDPNIYVTVLLQTPESGEGCDTSTSKSDQYAICLISP